MVSAARVLAFPGVLFGGLFVADALLDAGLAESLAVGLTLLLAGVAILVLQRLVPQVPDWRLWKDDAPVDLLHLFVSSGVASTATKAVLFGALVAGQARVAELVGGTLWPSHWHPYLQLALALLIADFGAYWIHRLSHEWEPLWRFHALHHSSERLAMLSSGRNHPLHTALTYTIETTPLVLLGVDAEVLALMTAFVAVNGMLQHANIAYALGPTNWIFATADLHRWHHSAVLEESKTNYGNNLIVFDVLFGTRTLPRDRSAPDAVGLGADANFPRTWLGHLASPWTWRPSAPVVAAVGGKRESA